MCQRLLEQKIKLQAQNLTVKYLNINKIIGSELNN